MRERPMLTIWECLRCVANEKWVLVNLAPWTASRDAEMWQVNNVHPDKRRVLIPHRSSRPTRDEAVARLVTVAPQLFAAAAISDMEHGNVLMDAAAVLSEHGHKVMAGILEAKAIMEDRLMRRLDSPAEKFHEHPKSIYEEQEGGE